MLSPNIFGGGELSRPAFVLKRFVEPSGWKWWRNWNKLSPLNDNNDVLVEEGIFLWNTVNMTLNFGVFPKLFYTFTKFRGLGRNFVQRFLRNCLLIDNEKPFKLLVDLFIEIGITRPGTRSDEILEQTAFFVPHNGRNSTHRI